MRFVDLLKATVLLSLASASVLALVTVITANLAADQTLVFVAMGWWLVCGAIGVRLGRRLEPTDAVATALREARMSTALPDLQQGRILLNRLWPLLSMPLGTSRRRPGVRTSLTGPTALVLVTKKVTPSRSSIAVTAAS